MVSSGERGREKKNVISDLTGYKVTERHLKTFPKESFIHQSETACFLGLYPRLSYSNYSENQALQEFHKNFEGVVLCVLNESDLSLLWILIVFKLSTIFKPTHPASLV